MASNKRLVTVHCVQVPVLLEAAVVLVLLATDVTGVAEVTCSKNPRRDQNNDNIF